MKADLPILDPPERLLCGPGPTNVDPSVLEAMDRPMLGHLDPDFHDILLDVVDLLRRVYRAPDGIVLPLHCTGTAGMETGVANLLEPGDKAIVAQAGFFGGRIAEIARRHGAEVVDVTAEWGEIVPKERLIETLDQHPDARLLAVVHAETSTGVVNPVEEILAIARGHGAVSIVDAVTSLGALPLRTGRWHADVTYSCTQKGLGAPSGLSPMTFSARALEARTPSRSFYLDLSLLEDYWVRRKYHHTISAPLVFALHEALTAIEEEGLEPRWERHRRNHLALAAGLDALGLMLLPPEPERLWTLNAVRVPDGIDEAAVRRQLLGDFSIEIGAGLGPLAGRIWRVGLMGSGSTLANVLLFLTALEHVLRKSGYRGGSASTAVAAAESV
jgi:alanine-glyoxylate transaminase / serine-glyoxylate transaminase / serine-pyruvate transaminase